ncbi:hypothetical protein [Streptomyces noursei]|uniref:hypothetical protein n=1 Tax=Streptomyces noursei TaxID=1971 RepID=UPI0016757A1D|nr:hypothetical protein [Streptomyces noursei]MCZ1017714.1 hypothetical protein [Streptomyces noursei]
MRGRSAARAAARLGPPAERVRTPRRHAVAELRSHRPETAAARTAAGRRPPYQRR